MTVVTSETTDPRIADLLRDARERLAAVSDAPGLEAEVLLSHALARPRGHLHAWPERVPARVERESFVALLARRLTGEPLAYVLGEREFWSLTLEVTPATLIPRVETELLVELALVHLPPDRPSRVADLGTGSGAIALAIARERPRVNVVATDRSAAALAVAARNARRLELTQVAFRQGDWCAALAGERFDLLVGNPPYVAADDPHLDRGDLRFEPSSALVAGADGLDAIRAIAARAPDHLSTAGLLLLEHGHDQAERVASVLRAAGFDRIDHHRDGAGIFRVVGARLP